jgi:hypothetical protein
LPIQNSFLYANYAEGGACGDKPASKEAFLGTFKEQVDAFEKDCTTSRVRLGNTLFIIWFGANDLYTANRKAEEMSGVAQEIAVTQRNRLAQWVRSWNITRMGKAWQSRFIFVDLCRPLTSVRYTKRLQDAEAAVKAKLGAHYVAPTGRFLGGISQARDTFRQGIRLGHLPGDRWYGADNRMEKLRAQIVEIKRLENGVLLFNATLKKLTHQNGDRLAEVSWCVSEETVQKLVQGNHRLKAGAMDWSVWSHISANDYSQKITSQNITTIDEVHPTDEMYRLLWLEIYEQIKRSGCTFGQLNQVAASTPLATLAGPAQPSPQTRQLFDAVMTQLTGGEED